MTSKYEAYLDALEQLTTAVRAAPRARTAATDAAQRKLDEIDHRSRAETDHLATRLGAANDAYRRAAANLETPDLAHLGLHLPATLTPAPNPVGPLDDAEYEQHRAVVALAGAVGQYRVRRQTQADAAREAAEALEARRAALEAARNQPAPRRFNPRVVIALSAVAALLLLLIVIAIAIAT